MGLIHEWVTLPVAVASEATGRIFCFLAAIDEAMRLTTTFDLIIFDLCGGGGDGEEFQIFGVGWWKV
jgi:hypothetical protein